MQSKTTPEEIRMATAAGPWWGAGCSSPWPTNHVSPNSEGTQVQESGWDKDLQNNVAEPLASLVFLKVFSSQILLFMALF